MSQRIRALAEARARARAVRIAARIDALGLGGVAVEVTPGGVSLRGRRLGVRFVRDPGFAALRNGIGRET